MLGRRGRRGRLGLGRNAGAKQQMQVVVVFFKGDIKQITLKKTGGKKKKRALLAQPLPEIGAAPGQVKKWISRSDLVLTLGQISPTLSFLRVRLLP